MSRSLFALFVLIVGGALGGVLGLAAAQEGEGRETAVAPIGAAFTYQGHLTDGGGPANGAYDFQFILYDAGVDGAQVGPVVTADDVDVSAGRFTVTLDFGPVFGGDALWLEIAVRAGDSTAAYTILSPRQPLTAAPYALGLRAGAVVSGAVSAGEAALTLGGSGDGLAVSNAGGDGLEMGSAGYYGVVIDSAGIDGVHVRSADGDGMQVISAGDDGVEVNSAGGNGVFVRSAGGDGVFVCATGSESGCDAAASNNGVEVGNAENYGVFVRSAGYSAFSVLDSGGSGLKVNHANDDGVFVCATGDETTCESSTTNNGLEVGSAEHYGVRVRSAGYVGVVVESAGWDGVQVFSAGGDGVYVDSAGGDGVEVTGDDLAGNFHGPIAATSCSGCLLAAFGVNAGEQPLEPGTVVTVQGTRPAEVDGAPVLMEVTRATAGQPVVGVVDGWAELRIEDEPRSGESGRQLIPRAGAAAPGAYVTIITHGPVQVPAGDRAISPGARVTVDDGGQARPVRMVEVDGVQLAESAPVIGIALSAPDAGGLVWVLVNPQ